MAARDPEDALMKALGHPLRRWLLRLCVEEGERLSPKELALVMKQSLSTVSYHARRLKELGALALVHEEPVRGSVAHFYEPTDLVRETPWVLAALGLREG
jgi:DNA-binding transcriptional ArsR family regulator